MQTTIKPHYALPLLGDSVINEYPFLSMPGFIYQINGPQDDVTFVTRIHPSLGEIDYDHFAVPAKFKVKRKVLRCTTDEHLGTLEYGADYVVLDSVVYTYAMNDGSTLKEVYYKIINDVGAEQWFSEHDFVTMITHKAPFHSRT